MDAERCPKPVQMRGQGLRTVTPDEDRFNVAVKVNRTG